MSREPSNPVLMPPKPRQPRAMTSEQAKARNEMLVFLEFLEKSGLPVDRDSVKNRNPPEPDILCTHNEQGLIAFELVEICDEEIAKTRAESIKLGGIHATFMWNADPTKKIICDKLKKKYKTEHPIELLCYTAVRLITPDDVIIPTVQHVIESWGHGMFRRVWFSGGDLCQMIYPAC